MGKSAFETSPPGAGLDFDRMPGHWLLARMGKRVLRPGGLELTRDLLSALEITADDAVVELAPGLGATARRALQRKPRSYVGVDRDEAAVAATRRVLAEHENRRYECRLGSAASTGLDADSATVLYGEAMLTMQTPNQKSQIVDEAFRVLSPGGRYGIHELALRPDDLEVAIKNEILEDLTEVIHVGARPLTLAEWCGTLEAEGFEVSAATTAPMHLLKPARMLRDEGVRGVLRIVFNLLRTPAARRRVRAMRGVFRKHARHLCAVMIVARKPTDARSLG